MADKKDEAIKDLKDIGSAVKADAKEEKKADAPATTVAVAEKKQM